MKPGQSGRRVLTEVGVREDRCSAKECAVSSHKGGSARAWIVWGALDICSPRRPSRRVGKNRAYPRIDCRRGGWGRLHRSHPQGESSCECTAAGLAQGHPTPGYSRREKIQKTKASVGAEADRPAPSLRVYAYFGRTSALWEATLKPTYTERLQDAEAVLTEFHVRWHANGQTMIFG